jgi:hypothetical protein
MRVGKEASVKKMTFVLVFLMLVAVPPVALAGGGGPESGHYSYGFFHWEQDYSDWGPACTYGQAVHVVYDATNSWTYVLKDGDVRETLVQSGTARVFDTAGHLLDERAFHVTERFFDAGQDVALRHDYGASVWYQVSHDWRNANLEEYQYVWKIPGVFDLRAWNRGGDWGQGWRSGECEGDGWPPLPPRPFGD